MYKQDLAFKGHQELIFNPITLPNIKAYYCAKSRERNSALPDTLV